MKDWDWEFSINSRYTTPMTVEIGDRMPSAQDADFVVHIDGLDIRRIGNNLNYFTYGEYRSSWSSFTLDHTITPYTVDLSMYAGVAKKPQIFTRRYDPKLQVPGYTVKTASSCSSQDEYYRSVAESVAYYSSSGDYTIIEECRQLGTIPIFGGLEKKAVYAPAAFRLIKRELPIMNDVIAYLIDNGEAVMEEFHQPIRTARRSFKAGLYHNVLRVAGII